MDAKARCETCIYFKIFNDRFDGQCRAEPPQVVIGDGDRAQTIWPETSVSDWCGRWVLDATKVSKA